MGILNRYILRQIAIPSILAVFVVAVVGVANEIQERITRLPLAQMTVGDVARLAGYFTPTIVAYLIPVTFMLGILLAFGRFSQNNELVAMKAAGVPMKRLLIPVLVVGALLSMASFWVQDRLQPWAVGKVTDLIFMELPLRATLDALPTGVMHEYAGWRVYIGQNDHKGHLADIIIVKPEDNGNTTTYYAGAASLTGTKEHTVLEMSNVHFIPPGESRQVWRLYAKQFQLPLPPIKIERPAVTRREKTLRGLFEEHGRLTEEVARTKSEPLKDSLQSHRREIADRLSLPFACLAVSFAAAPLGARARRSGKAYTFSVGFGILLIYYVLQMIMASHKLCSLSSELVRASIPNVIFCIIGVVFLWRVDRV